MTTDTAQQAAPARRPWQFETGWLAGRTYDSILIFGVLALALTAGAVVINRPGLFVPVLLIDLWLLGYHHVIATFTKLAGTAEDRKENKFLIYYAPVIVLVAVLGLANTVGLWSIITIYFFWQWFHYTRQAYGIAVFYRRRAPGAPLEKRWAAQLAVWAIPVWGVLHRCAQGWDEFLALPIKMPPVPMELVNVVGVFACLVTLWWLVQRVREWRAGVLPLGQTLFMASHMLIFYVAYIGADQINYGWLMANIWHNAQYILFVWLFNTKRFNNYQGQSGKWLAWASQPQPVRILFYFGASLLATSVFYGTLMKTFTFIADGNTALVTMMYVVTFQAVNFHHYLVDGYIWKARKKKHQVVLNAHAPETPPV